MSRLHPSQYMIACPSCGAALGDDSRFCDKCRAQLARRGYPQAHYFPFVPPMPPTLGPDLVQQALMCLVQRWNQLDLQEKIAVLQLAELAAGDAILAKQRIRDWLESRRIRSRLDQRQWQ